MDLQMTKTPKPNKIPTSLRLAPETLAWLQSEARRTYRTVQKNLEMILEKHKAEMEIEIQIKNVSRGT